MGSKRVIDSRGITVFTSCGDIVHFRPTTRIPGQILPTS